MNLKKISLLVSIIGITVLLIQLACAAIQEPQEETEPIFIPQEVKDVLKQGMEDRNPRMDIPFEIFENIYLPAQQNMHSIFLFKAKNKDLDFKSYSDVSAEETEGTNEAQETSGESDVLSANLNAFLWFQQMDGNHTKEVYVPFQLQEEKDSYNPEERAMYSVGYPLPPGKYLLAMAIASEDLQQIGTQYYEFELPDPQSFTDKLGTTPIFFIREIDKMESPETKPRIHKGFFAYSVLEIAPVLENAFTPGDSMEVFFYVFGAQPDPETEKFNITAHYGLNQDGEEIVRYAEGTYDAPIISQPLPLRRTVLVQRKKGDEVIEEKKETRDIEPGEYTFVIELKDNISGKTLEKKVNITMEESEE
ncbi:MAG: hypothetical protein ACOC5G_03995 [Acidobacteriota bacterium]